MPPKAPEFFVGWGTLALINAGLAQAKRRSGGAWFLISLLLGPIATLLIVMLDANQSTPGEKPFNLEDYRKQ
ncbi:MAG: antitermination protein NusB [Verrucomicrobia bacterium]|nr:antitermination protein NusB [Verrucomicrobiota bacterium]